MAKASNKNPSEIAYYYINKVLKVGGIPRRMRGVENATVAGIQRFLRRNKSRQNCSHFYLEVSELKLGGHTYKKYFYRDGLITLKT